VHTPLPLVIVTVPLASVHTPVAVIVTGNPELAVADTGKLLLYAALPGVPVNVIVWLLNDPADWVRRTCASVDEVLAVATLGPTTISNFVDVNVCVNPVFDVPQLLAASTLPVASMKLFATVVTPV
jgi:hypothetical protein